MLDSKIMKKINNLVYTKPRSIQEVAQHIGKNWRTADSYIKKIIEETGTLSVRTFREGTRGALKIVYWSNIEKIHSLEFQEKLFKKIELGKQKSDFSPFDIYQYVPENKRNAFLEEQEEEAITIRQDLKSALQSTKNQLLIFSGNLSWSNVKQEDEELINVFEELAKNNISIKILVAIDIDSMENVEKMLAINERTGKEMVEIRHTQQPLRAFLIDNKTARFKEFKSTKRGKKTYIFYDIFDEEWVAWLQKVFWNIFRTSISAQKRLDDIKSIENLQVIR
jgi:hypothetical protein